MRCALVLSLVVASGFCAHAGGADEIELCVAPNLNGRPEWTEAAEIDAERMPSFGVQAGLVKPAVYTGCHGNVPQHADKPIKFESAFVESCDRDKNIELRPWAEKLTRPAPARKLTTEESETPSKPTFDFPVNSGEGEPEFSSSIAVRDRPAVYVLGNFPTYR